MNYSELLQLAKGWGNFVSDRINIGRLPKGWGNFVSDRINIGRLLKSDKKY